MIDPGKTLREEILASFALAGVPAGRGQSTDGGLALGQARAKICAGDDWCEHFGDGRCRLLFPQGCSSCQWSTWLRSSASACPADPPRWGAD